MRRAPEEQTRLVREILSTAWALFDVVAPRDTGRYANGWARAILAVGGKARVTPLKVGKFRNIALDRLDTQRERLEKLLPGVRRSLDRWERVFQIRYSHRTRRDKSARWVKRKIESLRKIEADVMKTLDRIKTERDLFLASPYSVAVFGRQANGGEMKRAAATARAQIYGGTGRLFMAEGVVAASLHNREAHTSIVESRSAYSYQRVTASITKGTRAGVVRGRASKMIAAMTRG